MIDKILSGTGLSTEVCQHEIDESIFPTWNKREGPVYVCKKCKQKIYKASMYVPKPGERIHMSKKERRRKRKEDAE